jgi:hypothetical protein
MSELAGTGLAEFMRLRGRRVVEKCGAFWHGAGFGMYMSLPYYLRLDLDPAEAMEIIRDAGATGIRYPAHSGGGLPSGVYVCRRRDYGTGALHRNFRAHIRQGLPCCEVRELSREELLTQALAVNRETLTRQRRRDPEFADGASWRRFVDAVAACPCIVPVGSFVEGALASYAITCFEDGWLQILYKMNSMRFDSRHPSQVLDFSITRRIATDPSVTAVSMGWAPLVPNEGLHEYKLRLGYDFEPGFSVIRLRPTIYWALGGRWSRSVFGMAGRLFPGSNQLGVAAAVIEGAARTCAGGTQLAGPEAVAALAPVERAGPVVTENRSRTDPVPYEQFER